MEHKDSSIFYGTTIVCVRRQTPQGVQVAIGGDGQVTLGNIVVKGTRAQGAQALPRPGAGRFRRRHRRCLHPVRALRGQAGEAPGPPGARRHRADQGLAHRPRAAQASRPCWRWPTRRASLIITGNGDVLEPEHGIVAIGSGGAYAQSAARALLDHTELSAEQVVRESLEDRRRTLHLHQHEPHGRGRWNDVCPP